MRKSTRHRYISVITAMSFMGCGHTAASTHVDAGGTPPTTPAPTSTSPLPAVTTTGKLSVPDVVARVLPSVVSVSSTRVSREAPSMFPFQDPFFRHFFGPAMPAPRQFKEHGLGSGVIVQPDIILTNNHVIEGADEIKVTTRDKQEFKVKVVGADAKTDLAVLRLEGSPKNLTPIAWGDSSRLRLGDTVLAIGNPFGVGETVTAGIVSAEGRTDLGIIDYENFIQTDAAINPGNSGGALVNTEGQLVGINTAILSRSGGYQGVGFAIPTNSAKPIMDSLLRTGKVVRGWLGVGIQDLTPELAQAMKLPSASGVLVTSIQPDTPAAKAGLKRGDVILKVNGKPVDSTGTLRYVIAAAGVGAKETLDVLRAGKAVSVAVELGEAPNSEKVAQNGGPSGPATPGAVDGVTVDSLSPALRDKYDIPKEVTSGVVVTDVESGSKGAWAGLKPGDVVLEVNRKPIHGVDQFKTEWNRAKDQVLLLIQRGQGTLFIAVSRR